MSYRTLEKCTHTLSKHSYEYILPLIYPQATNLMYETFRRQHFNQLKIENRRRTKNEQWLQVEHNRSFSAWFSDQVRTQSKIYFRLN